MPIAHLTGRTIVRVSGEEARGFLDRLVTCDVDRVALGTARFGALLSPQGKILGDFILSQIDADGHAFLLDCSSDCASDLIRRLTMYRLRAKVSVAIQAGASVLAGWGGASAPAGVQAHPDPRLPSLGWRAIVIDDAADASLDLVDADAYQAHRVEHGVPESGRDFAFADAFPHEALMDQLGGVDFDKGCYVGQEIVSRMQHRGTARTRVVSIAWASGTAFETGSEIIAGERSLGRVGSVAAEHGLAMVRLDRAADALAAGQPILAGDVAIRFEKPAWIRFAYPHEMMAPAA